MIYFFYLFIYKKFLFTQKRLPFATEINSTQKQRSRFKDELKKRLVKLNNYFIFCDTIEAKY